LDDRTLFARRAGAVGIVVVVVFLVALGVKAYLASQEAQALKNYNSQVSALVQTQHSEVVTPFFNTLSSNADTSSSAQVTLESTLYSYYQAAQQEAAQAAAWSVPSQMAGAQQDLLLVLDLRAEALGQIQADIPAALGSNGQTAAFEDIAGAMGMLYSSDVIYKVRVVPLISEALTAANVSVSAAGLGGEQVVSSQFLQNQSWLVTSYVAGKILGNTPSNLGGTVASGTHGHELLGVTVGGTQLVPEGSGSNPTIPYTHGMVFTLSFKNTGENPEFDVKTGAVLESASFSAITANGVVSSTEPGGTYESQLRFAKDPPKGEALELRATVDPVQGETSTTNNTETFLVVFS
jgi:hypothetical protein